MSCTTVLSYSSILTVPRLRLRPRRPASPAGTGLGRSPRNGAAAVAPLLSVPPQPPSPATHRPRRRHAQRCRSRRRRHFGGDAVTSNAAATPRLAVPRQPVLRPQPPAPTAAHRHGCSDPPRPGGHRRHHHRRSSPSRHHRSFAFHFRRHSFDSTDSDTNSTPSPSTTSIASPQLRPTAAAAP